MVKCLTVSVRYAIVHVSETAAGDEIFSFNHAVIYVTLFGLKVIDGG